MTTARLQLADAAEAADLAAFLGRLLRFDRAAAVRVQAAPGPAGEAGVLAVFGRLPLGGTGVLAVRAARLAGQPEAADATVSAGQLLDAVDERSCALELPAPVTGPPWAGLLPSRTGWRRLAELPVEPVAAQVAGAVAEFRARSEALSHDRRTRAALDALADEIWSRPLDAAAGLPLRAAHAAHVLGFLRPGARLTVHAAGGWLRLATPHGSIAVRRPGAPSGGLGITPIG